MPRGRPLFPKDPDFYCRKSTVGVRQVILIHCPNAQTAARVFTTGRKKATAITDAVTLLAGFLCDRPPAANSGNTWSAVVLSVEVVISAAARPTPFVLSVPQRAGPIVEVILAEKPSVAREIAAFVGARTRHDGYLEGGGYQVTWAFGHLVELKEPHEYDPALKRWSLESLPFIPKRFELKLVGDTRSRK